MKAIVHIGTEKTGTTSIQKFLYLNRKKLKAAGFHFLQCAGKTNNRALPAYFVADNRFDDFYRSEGISTPEARAVFREQFRHKFEKEVSTLPKSVHTVIISSEHFHSRIRSREEMENVHKFFSSYFDDIRIVCYLRDQVSTCCSYYSTGLKAGSASSFFEFFERCNPENHYFNYFEMLSYWEQYFGFESLDVSLFSRNLFVNNSLLDDFTAKLDPALVGVLDTKIENENESLTPVGQALVRGVNMAFPIRTSRPETASVREKCKTHICERFRGTGRQPSLAMQQQIYNDFVEVNEALRAKYFPQMKLLFSPPTEEPAPIVGIDEGLIEGLSDVLKDLKKYGKGIVRPDEYAGITRDVLSGVIGMFQLEEEPTREGIDTVISREDLRLLMFAARTIESRDLKMAGDLLTLVRKIDPSVEGVNTRLEAYKKKEVLLKQNKYAITYTGVVESLSAEERKREGARFEAWLRSFADCIEGSAINVLNNTNSLRLEGTDISRKLAVPGGFTVVRVDSAETAYSIAERCPHLENGGTVFVSEVVQLSPYN